MSAPLSFEQAPPLGVPFRFFLTAPLFGVAAGVVFALRGEPVIASRWTLEAFAVVHLLTAGFMLQVMVGALLQFLPVAAGANVWRPRLVANVVHPALTLGAALLVAGFLGAGAWSFQAAAVLLGAGTLGFSLVALLGLWRSPAIGPTLQVLRAAVTGLVVTAGLGVALASGLGWNLALPFAALQHLHAAWGVLGWALMLVMGVAYLVVPMFQLTPPYAVRPSQAFPLTAGAALAAWTLGASLDVAWLEWAGTGLGGAATAGFAGYTLRLQAKRRRKVTDTTLLAWRVGMGCLLGAVLVLPVVRAAPLAWAAAPAEYLLGVLALAGAFPAVIAGMLYKIVPFIDWLHLQRVMAMPPTMQKVIPDAQARWQLRLFLAALAVLALAVAWPPLALVGGALFAAAWALLEWHLVKAVRLYRSLARGAGVAPARATV
ncbi:MAG: hypothetical protein ACOZQL_20540 [Myxococcota bacterium]